MTPYPAATSAPQDPTHSTCLTEGQANKLKAAAELYEPNLPSNLAGLHRQNQERVAKAITECLSEKLANVTAENISQALGTKLKAILNDANFDPSVYSPKNPAHINGYGKYLLYVNDEKAKTPFCLQIFAFGKEQKTVIHDHPCECTSLVYSGQLRERFYEINENGEARKINKNDRDSEKEKAEDTATLRPKEVNTHSLKNRSKEQPALSVHLYLMDGIKKPAAVNNIYSKAAKSSANNSSTFMDGIEKPAAVNNIYIEAAKSSANNSSTVERIKARSTSLEQ